MVDAIVASDAGVVDEGATGCFMLTGEAIVEADTASVATPESDTGPTVDPSPTSPVVVEEAGPSMRSMAAAHKTVSWYRDYLTTNTRTLSR